MNLVNPSHMYTPINMCVCVFVYVCVCVCMWCVCVFSCPGSSESSYVLIDGAPSSLSSKCRKILTVFIVYYESKKRELKKSLHLPREEGKKNGRRAVDDRRLEALRTARSAANSCKPAFSLISDPTVSRCHQLCRSSRAPVRLKGEHRQGCVSMVSWSDGPFKTPIW
jgi:hypothetical protein